MLVDPIANVDALNSQVFTAEDQSCLPNKGQSPHSSYTIADLSISTFGVQNLFSSLNIHKSAGPNKTNATILKETREVTAPIRCAIFCCSLQSGIVPKDWKQANVVPVYKKGTASIPQTTDRFLLPVLKFFEKTSAPT